MTRAYHRNVQNLIEPEEVKQEAIIPFERTTSGLVAVNVLLNGGVKMKMVFDTRSNLVVITEAVTEKLHKYSSAGDKSVKIYTNCGEVESQSSAIDKIELGGVQK